VFAISHDTVDVLRDFAERYGITDALLSDEGSRIIRDFGLLNERVHEHHATYGIPKRDRVWGVPYPGAFLLDEQGLIVEKRFPQSYRERETGVALLEQGFGVTSSIHGPEAVSRSEGVTVRAYLDADIYRYFQRLWLTVELDIDSGLHVYGQPIPAGYIPLSITVAPMPGVIIGEPLWPTPRPLRVDGVEEEFWVYEGKLTMSLPLTFAEEGDDHTVQVVIRYQACSATHCCLPSTIRLGLPLRVGDHIERPRSR